MQIKIGILPFNVISTLEQQAIQTALLGQWKKAALLNEKLLKSNPHDSETLTRLAFAYAKLGNFTKACKTYQRILKKDPYHPIASKNFEKYKNQKDCQSAYLEPAASDCVGVSPSLFLIDYHKTKAVTLINVAHKTILNNLSAGEKVTALKRGYDLLIKNAAGSYIGTLPDDIGRTIITMLNNGEKCLFFIKDANDHSVTIFIKWGFLP